MIETVLDHLDRTQENATNIQKPLGSLKLFLKTTLIIRKLCKKFRLC